MSLNKLRLIATLALVAVALSACAKLPTSSEVKVGSDIQSGLTTDYLYYSPSGPVEDATQTEIINGFLNAATGPQNDYQVARQYLAGALAANWNPSNELLIAQARPEIRMIGNVGARMTLNAIAQVDGRGRYKDLGAGVLRILDFEFVKEDGQWRISKAPDAIVVVRPVFDVLFKSYSLYFYDKQNRYLVPDLRWYASRVSTSTRLVSALLDGPTGWLSDSVQTSFPTKTKLAIDSVIVEDGKAIVDLDSSANHATVLQRQRMLAQLSATLTQLANVFTVEIRIDHIAQKITQIPYEVSLANNPDPIVLSATGFKVLSATQVNMTKANEAAANWQATDFAVNNQQTLLALKGPKGVGLVKLTGKENNLLAVDSRPGLLAPAIDPQGYLWSLGSGKDATLQAFDSTGAQRFVSLGWLNGVGHSAFAVSREGGRIAVLIDGPTRKRLLVAAITRDSKGEPIAISNPIEIGPTQRFVGSLSWVDESSIATILKSDEGFNYPAYLQVDGEIKKLSPVAAAKSVVANGFYSSAYVLDTANRLHVLRSLTWINGDSNVLAIHFAG